MARHEVIVIEDDIDGSADAKPVKFALDGVQYEIDLSDSNYAAMKDALAVYTNAGRRLRGGRAARR